MNKFTCIEACLHPADVRAKTELQKQWRIMMYCNTWCIVIHDVLWYICFRHRNRFEPWQAQMGFWCVLPGCPALGEWCGRRASALGSDRAAERGSGAAAATRGAIHGDRHGRWPAVGSFGRAHVGESDLPRAYQQLLSKRLPESQSFSKAQARGGQALERPGWEFCNVLYTYSEKSVNII